MRYSPSDFRNRIRKTKSEKILRIALHVNLAIIILLSAWSTFLPVENGRAAWFLRSPFYIIPWGTLILLLLLFPLIPGTGKKDKKKSIFIHYSAAVLLITTALSFAFSGKTEISLREGQTVSLDDIRQELGQKKRIEGTLTLDGFDIERDRKNGGISSYRSRITVSDGESSVGETIGVNAPLKIQGIFFFQKSWGFSLGDIVLEYGEKTFSAAEIRDKIIKTPDGGGFRIYPSDIRDGNIIYRWERYATRRTISASGEAERRGNILIFDNDITVKIVREDSPVVSVLEIRTNPLRYLPAGASVLFLFSLLFSFPKNEKKKREGAR